MQTAALCPVLSEAAHLYIELIWKAYIFNRLSFCTCYSRDSEIDFKPDGEQPISSLFQSVVRFFVPISHCLRMLDSGIWRRNDRKRMARSVKQFRMVTLPKRVW